MSTNSLRPLLERFSALAVELQKHQERIDAIRSEMDEVEAMIAGARSGGISVAGQPVLGISDGTVQIGGRPGRRGPSRPSQASAEVPADGPANTPHASPAERKVIDFVLSRPETRAKDLQEALGLSAALANQRLSELSRKNFFQKLGYGVYGPNKGDS